MTARARLPPIQAGRKRFSGDGPDAGIKQTGTPQMQHHLGHAAGEENLDSGKVARSIRQGVHQARHLAIHVGPVGSGRPLQFCRKRDGGNMQQKIGRSSKGRVDHHGVLDSGLCQDVGRADPQLMQPQNCPRRAASGVEPNRLAGRRKSSVGQG